MEIFSNKYLKPFILNENESFDEYCSKIPKLYFKPEIPIDVRQSFEVIEGLMAFSYYNHKFVDVGLTQALHTFEMALKIKFKELNPNRKPHGLKGIIHHFMSRGQFEANLKVLEFYENLRNQHAHPENHTFGGLMYMHAVEHLCRLINDLYEDRKLREERLKMAEEFDKSLKENQIDGFSVFQIGNETKKIFHLKLVFINNKLNPPVYILVYVPYFNLGSQPEMFSIKVFDPKFGQEILKLKDAISGEEIRISSRRHHPKMIDEILKWVNDWKNYPNQIGYEIELMKLHSSCFIPTMREFYKS